jgi:hypothetical protein
LSLLPPGTEAATISTFLVGDQLCAAAQAQLKASATARLARRMDILISPRMGKAVF